MLEDELRLVCLQQCEVHLSVCRFSIIPPGRGQDQGGPRIKEGSVSGREPGTWRGQKLEIRTTALTEDQV